MRWVKHWNRLPVPSMPVQHGPLLHALWLPPSVLIFLVIAEALCFVSQGSGQMMDAKDPVGCPLHDSRARAEMDEEGDGPAGLVRDPHPAVDAQALHECCDRRRAAKFCWLPVPARRRGLLAWHLSCQPSGKAAFLEAPLCPAAVLVLSSCLSASPVLSPAPPTPGLIWERTRVEADWLKGRCGPSSASGSPLRGQKAQQSCHPALHGAVPEAEPGDKSWYRDRSWT